MANKRFLQILFYVLLLGSLLGVVNAAATIGRADLVLWNKLGSPEEAQTSEVGPGFTVVITPDRYGQGDVLFPAGLYGGALATVGGEVGGGGYLAMPPDQFFGPDKRAGTVEMWLLKRIPRFIPYRTPLVGVFGLHPYDFGNGYYQSIGAFWSDGYTGSGGLQFQIVDNLGKTHLTNDLGWDNVPIDTWSHVAFVWDVAGIDGSADRLRIYRDGALVAANTDVIPDIKPDTREVRLLGHHAYRRFNQPTTWMDNLKVWAVAKTDFSDRFREAPNQPPDCSHARPSRNLLWPPNHQFETITLLAVTDPDGDPVTLTINAIFQDEPVRGQGNDNFAPDGRGLGSAMAEVRAERAGSNKAPGNGRVYHLSFTAADDFGDTCQGVVTVSVPHDQNGAAVDDGPLYDSTVP